jgi:hypothetical protein
MLPKIANGVPDVITGNEKALQPWNILGLGNIIRTTGHWKIGLPSEANLGS